MRKYRASIVSHPGQVRFQVSSIINVTGVVKMDRVRSCCSKTAEENEENAIKLNASSNSRTLNSLHQVNIMLLELDLRMLLYFFRKLSVVRKNITDSFFRETSFKMGCVLYTGAHYTRVNTIIKI